MFLFTLRVLSGLIKWRNIVYKGTMISIANTGSNSSDLLRTLKRGTNGSEWGEAPTTCAKLDEEVRRCMMINQLAGGPAWQ